MLATLPARSYGRPVWRILFVSAVVMGAAHTISRERIFQPLRRALGDRETWLGYLVSCPYCLSHWIAFALVPVTGTYGIRVPHAWGVASDLLSWFLSSLLVQVVASFLRIGFYFLDESQGLLRRRERLLDSEIVQRADARRTERSTSPES